MMTGIKKTFVKNNNNLTLLSAGYGVMSKNNNYLALDWDKGIMISQFSQRGNYLQENGGTSRQSGSGAGITTGATPRDGNHIENPDAHTGTTATGYAYFRQSIQSFYSPTGILRLIVNMNYPVLSTVTDEYISIAGLHDTDGSSSAATDGAYFLYNRALYGNFWAFVTAKDSVLTTTVSTIPIAAATWYNLSIEIDFNTTKASFYVNGVLSGTSNTNLPTSGDDFSWIHKGIFKTAGTTDTQVLTNTAQIEVSYTVSQ